MHITRLSTAALALPVAALVLMGPAAPAQALECGPGLVPAVVDGVQICAENAYTPGGPTPAPSYNPGESHYDPATGNYSEAVPGVPVPAAPVDPSAPASPLPTEPAPSPTASGTEEGTSGTGGTGTAPQPAATPSPTSSPSRTPSPSPSAAPAADEERTAADMVLPAVAAVVILGVLAGGLLLRHRNRSARR